MILADTMKDFVHRKLNLPLTLRHCDQSKFEILQDC
jgi:hypothetical protein